MFTNLYFQYFNRCSIYIYIYIQFQRYPGTRSGYSNKIMNYLLILYFFLFFSHFFPSPPNRFAFGAVEAYTHGVSRVQCIYVCIRVSDKEDVRLERVDKHNISGNFVAQRPLYRSIDVQYYKFYSRV